MIITIINGKSGFISRVSQIGHAVATNQPPATLPRSNNTVRTAYSFQYTLRRSMASN